MCGNKGNWEVTEALNESLTVTDSEKGDTDACKKTSMCLKPPETSVDGLLILQPYNPIDHKGHIMGGEAVYYK